MRTLRLLLTASVLAITCAPGAARAATVSLTYVGTTPATPDQYKIAGSPAVDRYLIRLTAGAGERNRMVVDVRGRLRDDGAPLTTGDGCAADAAGWITCTAPPRPPTVAVGYAYMIDAGLCARWRTGRVARRARDRSPHARPGRNARAGDQHLAERPR